jgi:hypothetical protein
MTIEPGRSVGPVGLGTSIRDVESLLGTPSSSRDSEREGWRCYEYTDKEVGGAYFQNGKLSSLIVVPTEDTILWGKSMFQLPASEIEQLLSVHGHAVSRCPSCHPAVRDRLDAPSAGLYFYLVEDRCDDIVVVEPGKGTGVVPVS